MADQRNRQKRSRSPVLAAILSVIFPGAGFFYLGNVLKGVAYIIVFAMLIALEVHASDYASRVLEIVVFGLLIAGFYIFQIIESYNDARALNISPVDGNEQKSQEEMSLFGSILVLVLGVVFLLVNFDVLTLGQIIKLWPLLLVAFGLKFILDHFNQGKKEGEDG